eukprot:TRINITY_DN518_c1_g1_i1.p1 TRINITY_DN518_c1_g1~~TRINITY_DN518_c1_g1_i1.p1  ORF type:complete len:635 (-),score=238.30 TRINITY_DN518_c1_g1_i1:184-2088(-)
MKQFDVNNSGADMMVGSGSGLNRYQEKDDDDFDDFMEEDVFDHIDDSDDEDEGDIDFAAKLNEKLQHNWGDGNSDESSGDESDPFAEEFESTFDNDIVFEHNYERDQLAKQAQDIMDKITLLQPGQSEEVILATCKKLIAVFRENPDQRSHLITHHGVIPIMEMLELSNPQVLHSILQVVNQIVEGNTQIQENLCLIGGIPAIMKFAAKEFSRDIRMESSRFVTQMCFTSTLTLQMFIACRGLPVLVDFLEPDYRNYKEVVFQTLDNIQRVFDLQSPTPRNDFCRLFAKSGLLGRVITAMENMLDDHTSGDEERLEENLDKASNLLLIFSHADSIVKQAFCVPEVLEGMMEIMMEVGENSLLMLLKAVKYISMDAATLQKLQQFGIFETLIPLLDKTKQFEQGMATKMQNEILNALYNLCRIDKQRQELAAIAGIIPHLQQVINDNSPLKQFALPIFCDMAHASKAARTELWKNDGVQFYLELLTDDFWQLNALDALAVWLQAAPEQVESTLEEDENVAMLVTLFKNTRDHQFVKMLNSFFQIVQNSIHVNKALGKSRFVASICDKLDHPDARARIQLLQLLTIVYEYHAQPKKLIADFDLYPVVEQLVHEDKAIMVQTMATKLLEAFGGNQIL